MTPFNQIRTIPELESALEQLKKDNQNLLSENPENYKTNFAELLTSPLFFQSSEIKPVKIFEAIVKAEMAFNISENRLLLDDLFNNNTSLNVHSGNGISKKHYEATKILAKKFGLTGDIAIKSQQSTITELLLNSSSSFKILETLEILLETNLLPTVENMGGKLPLPANIANSLADKINNMDLLSDVIDILKNKYDLHEFGGRLLQKADRNSIPDILNTFNTAEIQLNLNRELTTGKKLFEIISDQYSLGLLSYDKLLQSMIKHSMDFSDVIFNSDNHLGNKYGHTFASAIIEHAIQFHFNAEELLSIVKTTAKYAALGLTAEIEVHGRQTSALKMIGEALQNNQKDNKEFVKVLAQGDVNFGDVFFAFKGRVDIDKIIKPFAKKLAVINFNSPTSLLKEIFGYVENKEQFEKVLKLLSENNHKIDWGQPLNGIGGNSIFNQISHFYEVAATEYLEILKIIKEKDIKISFNSIKSLKFITDNINITSNIQELLSEINSSGFEVDKGMMAISLASSKRITLLEASAIIGIGEKLQHKLNISELPSILNILNINGNDWSLKANINYLKNIGFTQWEDNFNNNNNFLHATLSNCNNFHNAKVLLREGAKLKLDINAKNDWSETPLDILFQQHTIINSYDMAELFGILRLFKNTDWNKVVDAIDTPPNQQIINSLLENLPKDIDVTKPVNGKSLLNTLINKVNSLENLEYLLNAFNNKFKLELADHVNIMVQSVPGYLLNFKQLEQIFNKLDLKIDWQAKDLEPNILFVESLQRVDTDLLKENVEYLLTTLPKDFNWNKPLDSKGNNLLLLLAQHSGNNWQLIQDLVTKLDEQGLPIFNINYKNANQDRIMDLLVKLYKNDSDHLSYYITMLRENGSVEPKNPISTTIPRLDVNRDHFDQNDENKKATVQILKELYKVVNSHLPNGLTTEKINELINNFKNRDYSDYPPNIDWTKDNQFTIPQVVTELILLGDVKDRLNDSWNFKKVLAAIIYISDKNENTKLLLCNTLVALKLCPLGKLMNLLNVVQDTLSKAINYSDIEFKHYADMLNKSLTKIKKHFDNEQANKAVKEWVYELASKVDAAQWSPMTTMVQSIITKEFIAFMKPNFDSYHFIAGLKGVVIDKLIDSITSEKHQDQNLSKWYEAIQYAQEEIIQSLMEKSYNNEEIESILLESTEQSSMCFGDFRLVSKGFIEKTFYKLYKGKKDIALKFLIDLQNNLMLSTEVSGFIAQELSEALIGGDFKELKLSYSTIKFELTDNKTILSLLEKIPDLDYLLIKNKKINWLQKDQDGKTLLSEIAKLSPKDAAVLYQSHETEWESIINHEISSTGEIGDHFGDLI